MWNTTPLSSLSDINLIALLAQGEHLLRSLLIFLFHFIVSVSLFNNSYIVQLFNPML